MNKHTRLIVTVALGSAWTTGLLLAQGAAPAPQAPAPQNQAPAPAAPAGGRAAGRGQVQVPAGARVGGFTQFTRPLPSAEEIARGKALYDTNCASCHAPDLRGTADKKTPNLLREGVVYRDDGSGKLVQAAAAKHASPIRLADADAQAITGYAHSVQATMGGQGSPPGRNPTGVVLNVLVGDPAAGQTAFQARCGTCHSVTGDLKGIGSKYADARALQGGWVAGSAATFAGGGGGGGRGGGGGGVPATVTLADGTKLNGTLEREDDFLVVVNLPDGTRKVMARNAAGFPKVEKHDPKAGHVDAIVKLGHEDTDAKQMHDITAYLWSIK